MTTIINSINSFLYAEVVSYFRLLLKESIEACASNKMDIREYKTLTLDEYYEGGGWDILDADCNEVEGVDIISHFIILNEDTRADLECAFKEARDREFENFCNGNNPIII